MNLKRISLRFNLDNVTDRKAWEHLQEMPYSKNKTILTAINRLFDENNGITEVIRQTIRECFKDIAIVSTDAGKAVENISEEENSLLDSLDDFLGD